MKKLNQEFLNCIIKKDSASLARILADDFLMVNPSGRKLTKQDNLSMISSGNMEIISISIDTIDVRILTPDVGIVDCWQTFTYKSEGKLMTGKNCFQDIYRKRNKRWQAVAAHVTLLATN